MNHIEIFEKMTQTVKQAQKRGLLGAYEKDFYVYDKEMIEKYWETDANFLWVITPNGTHLTILGLHERNNDSAEATINTGYSNYEIYLVSQSGVRQITRQQAIDAAKQQLNYFVEGSCIKSKAGEKLAYMTIEKEYKQGNYFFDVKFSLPETVGKFSGKAKKILELIAINQSIKLSHSLFAKLRSVKFVE